MDPQEEYELLLTRRQFFGRAAAGIGTAALASLLCPEAFGAPAPSGSGLHGALKALHFAPKAMRVIYLFQSGAPSHIDLFDYKPKLKEHHGEELPGSVRMGQRIPALSAPGREASLDRRPGPLPRQPARHRQRQPPAAARWRRPDEPDRRAGVRRSGDQHPDRPVRDGVPHADLRAGADGSLA